MPKIKIDSCQECGSFKSNRLYTADSFEYAEIFECKDAPPCDCEDRNGHTDRRNCLHGVIEYWHNSGDKDPGIPKWCPKAAK